MDYAGSQKRTAILTAGLAVGCVCVTSQAASLNFDQANFASHNDASAPSNFSLSLNPQQISIFGYVGVGPNGELNFADKPTQPSGLGPQQTNIYLSSNGGVEHGQSVSGVSPSEGGGSLQEWTSSAGNTSEPANNGNLPTPQPCAPSPVQHSLWGGAGSGGHGGPQEPSWNNPEPKSSFGPTFPGCPSRAPHHATFVPLPAPLAGSAALLGMLALIQLRRVRRSRALPHEPQIVTG